MVLRNLLQRNESIKNGHRVHRQVAKWEEKREQWGIKVLIVCFSMSHKNDVFEGILTAHVFPAGECSSIDVRVFAKQWLLPNKSCL